MTAFLLDNVSASNFTFSDLVTTKKDNTSTKSVYIKYMGQEPIFQLPELKCVWGISKWDPLAQGTQGKVKYSVDLSLDPADNPVAVKQVVDFFEAFSERVKDIVYQNRIEWLPKAKSCTKDVADHQFNPLIKQKDGNKYAPTLRFNVPVNNGIITIPVYDLNGDQIKLDPENKEQCKGAKMSLIVKLSSIWFSPLGYGVTSYMSYIWIVSMPNMQRSFKTLFNPAALVGKYEATPNQSSSNYMNDSQRVSDSDDSDDDDDKPINSQATHISGSEVPESDDEMSKSDLASKQDVKTTEPTDDIDTQKSATAPKTVVRKKKATS